MVHHIIIIHHETSPAEHVEVQVGCAVSRIEQAERSAAAAVEASSREAAAQPRSDLRAAPPPFRSRLPPSSFSHRAFPCRCQSPLSAKSFQFPKENKIKGREKDSQNGKANCCVEICCKEEECHGTASKQKSFNRVRCSVHRGYVSGTTIVTFKYKNRFFN